MKTKPNAKMHRTKVARKTATEHALEEATAEHRKEVLRRRRFMLELARR